MCVLQRRFLHFAYATRKINGDCHSYSRSFPRQKGDPQDSKSNYPSNRGEILPSSDAKCSVHTRTRSLISSGSIRFVWRTLSPHGNDSNIASRRPGAVGYAPLARHTPVNFYRNTFPHETGEFPFAAKRRIYMILCAPAKQSVTRTQFSFSADLPLGERGGWIRVDGS